MLRARRRTRVGLRVDFWWLTLSTDVPNRAYLPSKGSRWIVSALRHATMHASNSLGRIEQRDRCLQYEQIEATRFLASTHDASATDPRGRQERLDLGCVRRDCRLASERMTLYTSFNIIAETASYSRCCFLRSTLLFRITTSHLLQFCRATVCDPCSTRLLVECGPYRNRISSFGTPSRTLLYKRSRCPMPRAYAPYSPRTTWFGCCTVMEAFK